MEHISDKKYIRLFNMLIKINPSLKLFEISDLDKEFITNLSYIVDFYSKNTILGYTYELNEGKIKSGQVENALNFIQQDFDGIISDIASLKEIYTEDLAANILIDKLEDDLLNIEYIKVLALSIYLRNQGDFINYGDVKKFAIKNKIDNGIDFEQLKENWRKTSVFIEYLNTKLKRF